jgi:hypothetical protein
MGTWVVAVKDVGEREDRAVLWRSLSATGKPSVGPWTGHSPQSQCPLVSLSLSPPSIAMAGLPWSPLRLNEGPCMQN